MRSAERESAVAGHAEKKGARLSNGRAENQPRQSRHSCSGKDNQEEEEEDVMKRKRRRNCLQDAPREIGSVTVWGVPSGGGEKWRGRRGDLMCVVTAYVEEQAGRARRGARREREIRSVCKSRI